MSNDGFMVEINKGFAVYEASGEGNSRTHDEYHRRSVNVGDGVDRRLTITLARGDSTAANLAACEMLRSWFGPTTKQAGIGPLADRNQRSGRSE